MYKKPASAGLKKAPRSKRRVELADPDIFADRFTLLLEDSQAPVTPVKITKVSSSKDSDWVIKPVASTSSTAQVTDSLDPDRSHQSVFLVVHRNDHVS